jgi:hypothetical protein
MRMNGERGVRLGGAVWRLEEKTRAGVRGAGERGAKGRGKGGLETAQCRGNNGGKMDKHGGGRVEERGEPGVVASVQTGYMDQMTRDGL